MQEVAATLAAAFEPRFVMVRMIDEGSGAAASTLYTTSTPCIYGVKFSPREHLALARGSRSLILCRGCTANRILHATRPSHGDTGNYGSASARSLARPGTREHLRNHVAVVDWDFRIPWRTA